MIPNITISFVSNNTINVTNSSGSQVSLTFSAYLSSGGWVPYSNIVIPANTSNTFTLIDNVYKFGLGINEVVILIYGNVLNMLKQQITTLLTSSNAPSAPAKYDFISLTLLGLVYLGNSIYQNVTYTTSPTVETDLKRIAMAIEDSNKYIDVSTNTPQSNLIWK